MAALQDSHLASQSDEDKLRQLEVDITSLVPKLSADCYLESKKAEFKTLDSALIAPIYYDTLSLDATRETLQILNLETTVDGFDDTAHVATLAHSCHEWSDRKSEIDPTTLSLSPQVSENDFEDEDDSEASCQVSELSVMFPTMTKFTLKKTFERSGGDLERATDELLNMLYIEQEGDGKKGIDGFGDDSDDFQVGRKGKQKASSRNSSGHRLHRSSSLPSPGNLNSEERISTWDKMNQDIVFISNSLGIPNSVVSSTYHSNGGILATTVFSLLKKNGQRDNSKQDSIEHCAQLADLVDEFGNDVNFEYLDRLLRLCKDKANVFLFADTLRRYRQSLTRYNAIGTKNNYMTPSEKITYTDQNQKSVDQDLIIVGTSLKYATPPETKILPLNSMAASEMADRFKSARNEAFQKAADSYRRSKSDRYMGGAAAFYAEIGKSYDSKTKELSNLAAEQMVTENSEEYLLDLHGVTVPQAIKIARERTTQWWVKSRPEAHGRGIKPLVIITGLGRHSKGGNSRLCPAVSKMLLRENWNLRVEEGQITVYSAK